MGENYPAALKIDYPDRPLNKVTTFFRLFMLIPIGIVLSLLMGTSYHNSVGDESGVMMASNGDEAGIMIAGVGLIVLPLVLMILFRKKYPSWWFDWNLNLVKFIYRVNAYACLMTDEYPSTDEDQCVHIDIPYPDVENDLNRWLPLVKWFLAIPHYIVLVFLAIAEMVVLVIVWFAILFTGRYPKGLFDFIEGILRWNLRVMAYSVILTTDKYPPFRLYE